MRLSLSFLWPWHREAISSSMQWELAASSRPMRQFQLKCSQHVFWHCRWDGDLLAKQNNWGFQICLILLCFLCLGGDSTQRFPLAPAHSFSFQSLQGQVEFCSIIFFLRPRLLFVVHVHSSVSSKELCQYNRAEHVIHQKDGLGYWTLNSG